MSEQNGDELPIIIARDVEKWFGDFQALKGITMEVHKGEVVVIFGPSGSGKSTLIHLLVRFRDPDTGCIQLGGEDVRNFAESDLRRSISVVTQQPHMFNATLRENLLIARPGAGDDSYFSLE